MRKREIKRKGERAADICRVHGAVTGGGGDGENALDEDGDVVGLEAFLDQTLDLFGESLFSNMLIVLLTF
jgi:hypothetical protein